MDFGNVAILSSLHPLAFLQMLKKTASQNDAFSIHIFIFHKNQAVKEYHFFSYSIQLSLIIAIFRTWNAHVFLKIDTTVSFQFLMRALNIYFRVDKFFSLM